MDDLKLLTEMRDYFEKARDEICLTSAASVTLIASGRIADAAELLRDYRSKLVKALQAIAYLRGETSEFDAVCDPVEEQILNTLGMIDRLPCFNRAPEAERSTDS